MLSWEGRSCNGFQDEGADRGVIFYGDNGSIFYGGGDGYKVYDGKNKLVSETKDSVAVEGTNTVSPTAALDGVHIANFIHTVQGKDKLNQPLLGGFQSTLIPQLGNIAQRVGRELNIDPTNGHILHDHEAEKLWHREYEPGWKLKV
jgi:hypothetical protein